MEASSDHRETEAAAGKSAVKLGLGKSCTRRNYICMIVFPLPRSHYEQNFVSIQRDLLVLLVMLEAPLWLSVRSLFESLAALDGSLAYDGTSSPGFFCSASLSAMEGFVAINDSGLSSEA